MRVLRKLLSRRRESGKRIPTELFATIMDSFARRFISESNCSKKTCLTELMGDSESWDHLTKPNDFTSDERREEFIRIYIENLIQGMGDARVLKFSMRNQLNRHVYHMVSVTTHLSGFIRMKRAMFMETNTKDEVMTFSEWNENKYGDHEVVLNKTKEEMAILIANLVLDKYGNEGSVTGKTIDNFVNGSPYCFNSKVQLKAILKPYQVTNTCKFTEQCYDFTRPLNDQKMDPEKEKTVMKRKNISQAETSNKKINVNSPKRNPIMDMFAKANFAKIKHEN